MHKPWKLTQDHPAKVSETDHPTFTSDDVLKTWLENKAKSGKYNWLLAHFDDGVLWGRFDKDGALLTSTEVAKAHNDDPEVQKILSACPELRAITLQEARLFSEQAELLLWRDGDNQFHYRIIENASEENSAGWTTYYDESQLLWGTNGAPLDPGPFTLLWDGAQGLRHILPMPVQLDENGQIQQSPRLFLRHYLNKETDGMARVVASRLLKIDDKE